MPLPDKIYIEMFGMINFYLGMGIKIITALLLGGLIGWDREIKMKAAGLKTNILICIGSTLYTAISLVNLGPGINADPNRMAAQIVSGIGFLGAGAIIHGKGSVTGLTTAATIWVVAAIGVTIGSGHPMTAIIFTLTTACVLLFLNPIVKLFARSKDFHLELLSMGTLEDYCRNLLMKENIEIKELREEILEEGSSFRVLHIYIKTDSKTMGALAERLNRIVTVKKLYFDESDDSFINNFFE